MTQFVDTDEVGRAVDTVCNNKRRDIRKVAGRFLEEAVELAAACGVTPAEMRSHVEDSIHNMCLKQSFMDGRTVFPSQLTTEYNSNDVVAEAGDTLLLLKDVLYLSGHLQSSAERFAALKHLQVRNLPAAYTSYDGSTFYKRKDHIK